MTSLELHRAGGVAIDYEAVLKALNLNPADPKVQALVLTCQQYGLDPVLKHMILINGNAYITHKGLLHVAHESGRLDGIELVEQGETDGEWWAKVSVFRKDMGRPFTYVGRYPRSGTNKQYGPEMAITRAECMALRRAFDVAAPVQEEQDWPAQPADATPTIVEHPPVVESPPAAAERRAEIKRRAEALSDEFKEIARAAWKRQIAASPDDLTDDQADAGEKLLDDIEAQQKAMFDKRRKRARAELTKAGVKDEADVDALVLAATNGATSSTAQLTEAQLAAVLDQLKPLVEARENQPADGSEAA